MRTKVVQAFSPAGNYGKFLLGRMEEEWAVREAEYDLPGVPPLPASSVTRNLLRGRGWTYEHLWVLDLQTGEGALFRPGGHAANDLDKHKVWVCPLFEPFLAWLYTQSTAGAVDIDHLPDVVELDVPLEMQGYRRAGEA